MADNNAAAQAVLAGREDLAVTVAKAVLAVAVKAAADRADQAARVVRWAASSGANGPTSATT